METIWFVSWESLIRTICLTTLGYTAMVLLLRVSGKRTLSKMNAFDFIVTIALGSCLASVALNKNISLADGATAIGLFIAFQFVLTWLSVRIKPVKKLITSTPSLLFYNGEFLNQTMKRERITEEEISSTARQQGLASLEDVDMIILESTGDIAIIEKATVGKKSTIDNVKVVD